MVKYKLSYILILFILMLSSGLGVKTYDSYNHPGYFEDFDKDNKGLIEVYTYRYIVFSNNSFDLDEGKNYIIDSKTYLYYNIFNQNDETKQFVFVTIFRNPDSNNTYAYGNFINISGGDYEEVIIDLDTNMEYVATEIYCVDNTSTCGSGYQVSKELLVYPSYSDYQTQTIFTPLITSVVDLIKINLSIWRLIFYIFILTIIITLVYLVFRLVFYLLNKIKSLDKEHNL